MTDIQRITMIPATYLSRGSNQVSSFDLLKFIECLHLARGKLSGPEASLLHCLVMRGWTNGTFRVPQSILSLAAPSFLVLHGSGSRKEWVPCASDDECRALLFMQSEPAKLVPRH